MVDRGSTKRLSMFVCLLLTALVSVGCGARADAKPELTVFAAASLTDAFEELGEDFERRNPGVEVRFNFAGSSTLLAQLRQGAPADVFASADESKMDVAERHALVGKPRLFANNSPVVIVPEGNPAGVEDLRDLAEPGVDLVLAQDGVPIAEYTKEVLRKAHTRYGGDFGERVMENVFSRETNVRAAANRVILGEVDATFVYASDVTPGIRNQVEVVGIPERLNVVANYLIAVANDAPDPGLAREWVDLVLSNEGQRTLEKWEFRRTR